MEGLRYGCVWSHGLVCRESEFGGEAVVSSGVVVRLWLLEVWRGSGGRSFAGVIGGGDVSNCSMAVDLEI